MQLPHIIIIGLIVIIIALFICSNRQQFKDVYEYLSEDEKMALIRKNDAQLQRMYKQARFTKLLDNNKKSLEEINKKAPNYKIAFVTFEDRDEEYIRLHNKNVKEYCDKWGYEYIHATKNKNGTSPYWFKVFLVQELILSNKYDYVFWLDSDTIINNFNIDLGKDILYLYNSDIFLASDNTSYDVSNSGLFIVRNSEMGRQFLDDWTKSYLPMCEKEDGKLKGKWAMSCYEQGIMNKLIQEKYGKYTTFLDSRIFYNKNRCSKTVFITHFYGAGKNQRAWCFRQQKH